MDPHCTFLEEAAPLGVERLIVLSPKERLRQTRRCRVIEPNDFCRRNHDRIRIAVLLHRRNQRSADSGPGHTEQVTASGNSIRQVRQRHYATR